MGHVDRQNIAFSLHDLLQHQAEPFATPDVYPVVAAEGFFDVYEGLSLISAWHARLDLTPRTFVGLSSDLMHLIDALRALTRAQPPNDTVSTWMFKRRQVFRTRLAEIQPIVVQITQLAYRDSEILDVIRSLHGHQG